MILRVKLGDETGSLYTAERTAGSGREGAGLGSLREERLDDRLVLFSCLYSHFKLV
jgi:hypothetical protein